MRQSLVQSVGYDQVKQVCDKLNLENRKISTRAIHAETGGSMSTVLEHLQRWQKEKQGSNQKDMLVLSDRLKEAIFYEITERVNSAKSELNEQLATALNHLNESRELLAQAENKIDDLNAEKQTLIEEKGKLAHEFEKQSALLDQRLQALQEECKGKLDVAQHQIEAQSKEISDLRNMKGDAEKRAAVAEAHAEDRANQIALLLGQIEDLKEEKSGLRSMLDSALKDRNEAEKKAATLEARLKEKR
jgi:chromosome segregation ATPase